VMQLLLASDLEPNARGRKAKKIARKE